MTEAELIEQYTRQIRGLRMSIDRSERRGVPEAQRAEFMAWRRKRLDEIDRLKMHLAVHRITSNGRR